jgi:hypothetical protein
MSDTEILSELILESALIPLEIEYGKPVVKLQETGIKDSVCYIYNMPPDAIVIKADDFTAPMSFFKGSKGERKRADFIIISEEKKVVLYIELKAGEKDTGHIVKQLKGAFCVVSYCKEIGSMFWDESTFLEGYAHRFVGMIHLSVSKKTTRRQSAALHDSPGTFLKISSPHHIQFNELAAV